MCIKIIINNIFNNINCSTKANDIKTSFIRTSFNMFNLLFNKFNKYIDSRTIVKLTFNTICCNSYISISRNFDISIIFNIINLIIVYNLHPYIVMPFKCSIIIIKTIIKTIVICYMMINSVIVNFMMFGMTVKIKECFFFYCCKSLMISNNSMTLLIRLSTNDILTSMEKLIR